jgi:hypothetical protein
MPVGYLRDKGRKSRSFTRAGVHLWWYQRLWTVEHTMIRKRVTTNFIRLLIQKVQAKSIISHSRSDPVLNPVQSESNHVIFIPSIIITTQ